MRISVVGTGYVGLVSGACLAEKGHQVTCVDLDADKVARINRGDPPIYEPGLEEILKRRIQDRLKATTDLQAAIAETEISIVAVGTPFSGSEIDLGFVRQVAKDIGAALKNKSQYHVVVVKSTVVPGTTDDVVGPLLEESAQKRIGDGLGLGMNPEFLREGCAVSDFMDPDRIVVGGSDARTQSAIAELYSVFKGVDVVLTNNRTAEMIKYTANSLLATAISFSNEIANLCSGLGGIDVQEVMHGVHLDKRLSPLLDGQRVRPGFLSYLACGCGFGGSCFPKDVKALVAHGRSAHVPMRILESVLEVNAQQPLKVVDLLTRDLGSLASKQIAILGLAFKPDTDDIRESPAIPVIQALLKQRAQIRAYDPIAMEEAKEFFKEPAIAYQSSIEACVQDADAVVVLTAWPQFKSLPKVLEGTKNPPLVVDGRRIYEKGHFLRYTGIGL